MAFVLSEGAKVDKKMALKKMKIAIINYETYLKNHEYLIIYNEDDNYQLRKIITIQILY